MPEEAHQSPENWLPNEVIGTAGHLGMTGEVSVERISPSIVFEDSVLYINGEPTVTDPTKLLIYLALDATRGRWQNGGQLRTIMEDFIGGNSMMTSMSVRQHATELMGILNYAASAEVVTTKLVNRRVIQFRLATVEELETGLPKGDYEPPTSTPSTIQSTDVTGEVIRGVERQYAQVLDAAAKVDFNSHTEPDAIAETAQILASGGIKVSEDVVRDGLLIDRLARALNLPLRPDEDGISPMQSLREHSEAVVRLTDDYIQAAFDADNAPPGVKNTMFCLLGLRLGLPASMRSMSRLTVRWGLKTETYATILNAQQQKRAGHSINQLATLFGCGPRRAEEVIRQTLGKVRFQISPQASGGVNETT